MALRISTMTMSNSVTVRMLPKRNESALACSLPELMTVIAVPTLSARTMVKIRSVYFLKYRRRNSISAPQMDVNRNAPRIGFWLVKSPIVIPASDAWESVSPIIEYLLSTRKIPMHGQRMEMQMETKNAFCIKAY